MWELNLKYPYQKVKQEQVKPKCRKVKQLTISEDKHSNQRFQHVLKRDLQSPPVIINTKQNNTKMSGEDSAYKIKLPFSGKKEDWDLWDMKFSAIAQEKGWHEVLNESVKPSTTSDGKRDSSDAEKKKVWRKMDAI